MDRRVLVYSCFILFGSFISSVSQVILKKSAMKKHDTVLKEYLNVPVIGSYFIFFIATLCSVMAYKEIPLSMGPILESSSYIYVTIFGVKIFHERISATKIVALGIIIMGIVVYSMLG